MQADVIEIEQPDNALGNVIQRWGPMISIGLVNFMKTLHHRPPVTLLPPSKEPSAPHFANFLMPRTSRPKKRRRSTRRKSSKKVTKTGVKRIIANQQRFLGQPQVFGRQDCGWAWSGFNARGFCVIPFHYICGHANATGDMDEMWTMAQSTVPTNTSTVYPATAQVSTHNSSAFDAKKTTVTMLLHNPMTAMVKVKIWFLKGLFDGSATSSGSYPWHNSTAPYNPGTNTYSYSNVELAPLYHWFTHWSQSEFNSTLFEEDLLTYPTFYPGWKKAYEIKTKDTYWLQPGQTIELHFKLPHLSWNWQDWATGDGRYPGVNATTVYFLKNISHFIMMETTGIPTHQNDGETNSEDSVGMTQSKVEFLFNYRRQVGCLAGKLDMRLLNADNNYDTITAARTLINPAPENLQSV